MKALCLAEDEEERLLPVTLNGPAAAFLYQENPVLDTGFVEATRLNINFPTVKLKLRFGNCNKV